ncbi:rhodanese-like domain-containing protein [Bdellovibrio sp. HCB2-146]|uniref:rhodanese-like domain-containing protein n=1 Tax=Bdellovibrio sp. HCB2-146 TaxID=3394362 RepID=UPI0039BD4F77
MDLNQLGFFQFDNLVQGRVPFILINMGADLSHIYKGFVAQHLQNVTIDCNSSSEAVSKVLEKKLPNHYAVVVIDHDGSRSGPVVTALEKAGCINVYYVKGGVKGIDLERQGGN